MPHSSRTDLERISRQLRRSSHLGNGPAAIQSTTEEQSPSPTVTRLLEDLVAGNYHRVLSSSFACLLLGHEKPNNGSGPSKNEESDFISHISRRVDTFAEVEFLALQEGQNLDTTSCLRCLFLVGLAALSAFLQSNVTGPPLSFSSERVLLSASEAEPGPSNHQIRREIIASLKVDGVAPYALIPNVELFALAKVIFNKQELSLDGALRHRIRVNFLHQRLLSEEVSSLQTVIYDDIKKIDEGLPEEPEDVDAVEYLLEKAAIHTYYGSDTRAREDLNRASKANDFQFALTGRLGRRTKFQQTDISQLVVLALSASDDAKEQPQCSVESQKRSSKDNDINGSAAQNPTNLDLNDDTLLETISFPEPSNSISTTVQDEISLPPRLASLEPGKQPPLEPLDSIILLLLASSITNTSPSYGLTREETLPYATRVLEGGSTNWQVYTHALLVRSRIEGYRSRTQERGVLQLQALVDQVTAETTAGSPGTTQTEATSTFLPKAKEAESASVTERLRYVYPLSSPTRWEIESELAARWISLGGLKTALEIYERLQMWAEVALCHAGLDDEKRARKIIRKQLFHSRKSDREAIDEDEESWDGPARQMLPADAPRLYCILGDIDRDPTMYEKAWEESHGRYARAQRALGKHYFSVRDYAKSAESYAKSLKINQLNHSSWYALGCARLQLEEWDGAIDAFARAVQIDDQDAESWSNLAAALLEKGPASATPTLPSGVDDDADTTNSARADSYRHKKDALKALKQASRLKHDDWRIWENFLTVSASITPPPYADVVVALRRIIQIRSPTLGERAVDEDVLDALVRHIIQMDAEKDEPTGYDPIMPGVARMVVELVEKDVLPLITASRRLWQIIARLALWRRRPSSALEANEKAWRAVISQPGWESGTEKRWDDVVDATVELVDAYESLGGMERTEGLAAGAGQLVAKDWKFKARSAIRGIKGRGKESFEGTDGWGRLTDRMEELTGS